MSTSDQAALLSQLVADFNQGDLAAFDRLLLPGFFGYQPQPKEPTAPEAFREIGQALRAACPDLRVTLGPTEQAGETLRGRMTLTGTFTGNLWGQPGDGLPHTLEGTAVARFEGDRLAVSWEKMNFVGALRGMGVMPQPEKAHLKPPHPVGMPEIILRLIFNGMKLQ